MNDKEKKPKLKRKPSNSKNQYFTSDHENAIVRYVSSSDIIERTNLYIVYIEPSLSEMVDKIIYTYKFTSLPNINYLKEECKIWLVTVLDKFDQSKGSKAFSYFSIITKNWFIAKTKKCHNQNKKEINYEEMAKDLETKYFSNDNLYSDTREDAEFWEHLLQEVDRWDQLVVKDNEKKVLEAIKILLGSINEIEIFNKKAIYFFLREITGLSTKQIVIHLNRFRSRYKEFKKRWDAGEV